MDDQVLEAEAAPQSVPGTGLVGRSASRGSRRAHPAQLPLGLPKEAIFDAPSAALRWVP
ncbi:hypothetical protein ABZ656_46400 [Streptomyces sp. NPDC007095]|uniref:hypothetical protein n=1 Tax=Streptomyces sp. NPDC007095 TaxID=3154482 RepID=UPI0033EE1F07